MKHLIALLFFASFLLAQGPKFPIVPGSGAGTPGKDACVAWADDDAGTGFSTTVPKDYMATRTLPSCAAAAAGDFAGLWKLTKGDDGANGANGSNGLNACIAYADASDGTGFSLSTPKAYIATINAAVCASTVQANYAGKWLLAKGDTGDPGDPGADGAPGDPGPTGPPTAGIICVDAGSTDAYACTTYRAFASYDNVSKVGDAGCTATELCVGQTIQVKVNTNNTGAATLAVDGLSAKPIKVVDATTGTADPPTDSLVAGRHYIFVYDGVNMQIGSGSGGGGETLPSKSGNDEKVLLTSGLTLSWVPVVKHVTQGTAGGVTIAGTNGADPTSGDIVVESDGTLFELAGNNTITGIMNAAGASFTAPFKIGTSDPATCVATSRPWFYNTTSGLLKVCNATNTWTTYAGGGGGGGTWGSITGTLSAQTDLQTALNAKAPLNSPTLVTPVLGVATATSINGTSIPSSSTLVTTAAGNATTATALAANGSNCSAAQAAIGVNASGAAEGCWTPVTGASSSVPTEILVASGTDGKTLTNTLLKVTNEGIFHNSSDASNTFWGGGQDYQHGAFFQAFGASHSVDPWGAKVIIGNASNHCFGVYGFDGASTYTAKRFEVCGNGATTLGVTTATSINGVTISAAKSYREIQFVFGAGTNIAASDTISVPRLVSANTAGSLVKFMGACGTGPTGANLTFALKIGGTTTATLTIAAGATTGNTTSFSTGTLTEGDLLTVVVGTVGSTIPGKDCHLIATVN